MQPIEHKNPGEAISRYKHTMRRHAEKDYISIKFIEQQKPQQEAA